MGGLSEEGGRPAGTAAATSGNVDEKGTVLFLDEDRMRRKEKPGKKIYRPWSDPFGILDALVKAVAIRKWNYRVIHYGFPYLRKIIDLFGRLGPFWSRIFKYMAMLAPESKAYITGTVYNLNVDLEEQARNVTLPIDFVREAVRNAEYVAGMNKCFCRDGYDCGDYPHDLGCLFLNGSGRAVVEHGIAAELTREQALERIDRAAELGLVCQALWVQVERFLWGLTSDKMNELLEICFCCPCCCAGLSLCVAGDRSIKQRFAPSGWTAVCDREACDGCRSCAPHCPQEAISFRESDGKQVIDQEVCMGCGICKTRCEAGAISIKQTMPMRESLHAYFLEEGRLDLK